MNDLINLHSIRREALKSDLGPDQENVFSVERFTQQAIKRLEKAMNSVREDEIQNDRNA